MPSYRIEKILIPYNYNYTNHYTQIKASVQRASSVALTTDGAGTHTGESYVVVTGHWIDRIPTPTLEDGFCCAGGFY